MRAIHPDGRRDATPIGAKLRAARTAQGMSLAQVAETTGLSKGFLSRVERDETSPSVATLVQLCQVLSLPVGALFAEPEVQHVAYADAPRINLGGFGATSASCRPGASSACSCCGRNSNPTRTAAATSTRSTATSRCCTSSPGRSPVRFVDRSVTVHAGDALTFPGREPHTWQVEEGPATVVWVIVPAPWSGSA